MFTCIIILGLLSIISYIFEVKIIPALLMVVISVISILNTKNVNIALLSGVICIIMYLIDSFRFNYLFKNAKDRNNFMHRLRDNYFTGTINGVCSIVINTVLIICLVNTFNNYKVAIIVAGILVYFCVLILILRDMLSLKDINTIFELKIVPIKKKITYNKKKSKLRTINNYYSIYFQDNKENRNLKELSNKFENGKKYEIRYFEATLGKYIVDFKEVN